MQLFLVVTNPLDVATYYVSANFDYPREKIIGTGTLLETFRYVEFWLIIII